MVGSGLQNLALSDSFVSIIDEADANTIYLGGAEPGTPENMPKWRIKKITVSGNITKIQWAGGTIEPIYAWTDRYNLEYM